MAQLTGVLTADFSDFTRAVDQAQVQLKGFEGNAGKVESSLSRMTNSLSGTKLIQDATLMAEAVELIGGASKLTDAELKRLGATAAEAVQKMERLGVDVPDGLRKIADGAKAAELIAAEPPESVTMTRLPPVDLLTASHNESLIASLLTTELGSIVTISGALSPRSVSTIWPSSTSATREPSL